MRMILSITTLFLVTTTAGFSSEKMAIPNESRTETAVADYSADRMHANNKGRHHHPLHSMDKDQDKMRKQGEKKMGDVKPSSSQQPMPANNSKLNNAASVLNTSDSFSGEFNRNS